MEPPASDGASFSNTWIRGAGPHSERGISLDIDRIVRQNREAGLIGRQSERTLPDPLCPPARKPCLQHDGRGVDRRAAGMGDQEQNQSVNHLGEGAARQIHAGGKNPCRFPYPRQPQSGPIRTVGSAGLGDGETVPADGGAGRTD